jgi:Fe-S-cluster-containing hydrogenase component 2
MAGKKQEKETVNIYELLIEASSQRKLDKRTQLLESLGVKEFFEDGSIRINLKTCKGVECQFCIKVCPTNALYWKHGEIGIVEDLCIYCTSCVLNCMVDNCIEIRRKRPNGGSERFSTTKEVFTLLERVNAKNREKILKQIFPY